ncbi:DUF5819 family protein [Streptomyces sp. RY43-2]|uniref:DUF5819 family protein n=1 Tax=Streptomyces macrolidinus TaxID=2952607 RepID=A0ABT0ZEV5_9ACTN|nr:DUF5819 family protein [Streptomyces macrolidinus]MCN9242100.1 DUF5819 family protein [Streptomyces macrolidinus]
MDAYDEESGAREAEPDGSDAPVSPPPEGGGPDVPPAPPGEGSAGPREASTGIAALSPHYRVAAALALVAVAAVSAVHLGMVFLHVAPPNTVTKQHGKAIDDWIYPEFEQNWKLFAPNPLQQNIDVQVRAEVLTPDGGGRTTGWYDLSARDGEAIAGNLLPSHTQQNELRRAWDFYVTSHDGRNRPQGPRGALSESYLRRVVLGRLDRERTALRPGETVDRVQVRSRTTNVPSPRWSDERVPTAPVYRHLPWWPLPADDETGAGTR